MSAAGTVMLAVVTAPAIPVAAFNAGQSAPMGAAGRSYFGIIEQPERNTVTQAVDSFKAAVDRGRDLETYNSGYKQALEKMQTIDPKGYYQGLELPSPAASNWIGE